VGWINRNRNGTARVGMVRAQCVIAYPVYPKDSRLLSQKLQISLPACAPLLQTTKYEAFLSGCYILLGITMPPWGFSYLSKTIRCLVIPIHGTTYFLPRVITFPEAPPRSYRQGNTNPKMRGITGTFPWIWCETKLCHCVPTRKTCKHLKIS
jgi:hypothetical protein